MHLSRLVIVLFAMFLIATRLFAEEYTINMESGGKLLAVIELSVVDDEAIAKVGDMVERFDLKNQRWQDVKTKQWVSLAQCELWAKKSKDKSATSTASIPEKVRRFVEWSLSPQFLIEKKGSVITFKSGQVDYTITVTESNGALTSYYQYARLNAYKKAMTERKLPPFAELKVLEELERRKLMPTSMEVQIPGVPDAPEFKLIFGRSNDGVAETIGKTKAE